MIRNRVPKTIFVLLREDATCGKSGGVAFNTCGEFRVVDFEYWFLTELFLYRVESLLLFLRPMPGNILLSEVMERTCHSGKVLYEPLIEVGKAYERSYFLECCWCRPIFYCSNLARVHLHFSWANDHPEVFHRVLLKFAFFRL